MTKPKGPTQTPDKGIEKPLLPSNLGKPKEVKKLVGLRIAERDYFLFQVIVELLEDRQSKFFKKLLQTYISTLPRDRSREVMFLQKLFGERVDMAVLAIRKARDDGHNLLHYLEFLSEQGTAEEVGVKEE